MCLFLGLANASSRWFVRQDHAMRFKAGVASVLMLVTPPGKAAAAANDSTGAERAWKLTLGRYVYAGYSGSDFNLRWRRDDTSAWVGIYTDRVFGTQARAGADTSVDVGRYLQVQPSVQLASLGFAGGGLHLEGGGGGCAM